MAVFFFGLAIFAWLKPADDYSYTERKTLKSFPKLTWEAITKKTFMTDFESYTLDQFPMRDAFFKIKGGVNLYLFGMKNNIRGDYNYYEKDGYVSEVEYPLNSGSLDYAANRFKNIYDRYLNGKKTNIYFSIVPDKNYFMAEDAGQLSMDYEAFVSYMKEKTDYMKYIDIMGLLSIEDYYKTDTHWRQEKIVDVAQKLGESMGVTLSGNYKENVLDNPFGGVYYGQSGLPFLAKEELVYLTSDVLDACTVKTYDEQGRLKEMSMYDMEKAFGKDPYEIYLSGSLSFIEITNPNATSNKELVIFRDSFGSSLSPLLVEGYKKVTVVDIRYMNSAMLNRYVRFTNQDVLFIYSTLVLNNSSTLT
jgi:hypothetical protein